MKAIGLISVTSVLVLGLCVLGLLATGPAKADPPLAGKSLFTVSHGQPFCTTREALRDLVRAQIARAPYVLGPACQFVEDNAIVLVGEDLAPRRRYMHMVRARAALPFGTIEGYTYSVGLYPYPVRPEHYVLHLY